MANISLDSINSLLSGGGISAISKRTKLKTGEVANVLTAGIPILLTGMKRNSATQAGERSLRGALSDHSTADVSDVGAFLKTADLKDGKKILGHVLGSDQKAIVDKVSKASGVSAGKTTSILALIAPLLLTLLGGQQSQQGSSFNLLSLLGTMLGGQSQQPQVSPLQQLLGMQPQQAQQSGGLQLIETPQQTQQTQQQSGSVLDALGGIGGLMNLFGSSEPQQPQQQAQDDSNPLLDGFLNLFR